MQYILYAYVLMSQLHKAIVNLRVEELPVSI